MKISWKSRKNGVKGTPRAVWKRSTAPSETRDEGLKRHKEIKEDTHTAKTVDWINT